MKRLYASSDFMLIGHLRTVLEQHRIIALVKNAYLAGAAGELPPTAVWPELWVEEEDWPRAREIIDGVLESAGGAVWTCPRCGETVEPQFAVCWACGEHAP